MRRIEIMVLNLLDYRGRRNNNAWHNMLMAVDRKKVSLDIAPYLHLMIQKGASDIFFNVGSPISMRINGGIVPIGKSKLSPDKTDLVAQSIMNNAQYALFNKKLEIDFTYILHDVNERFRVNVFKQQSFTSVVMRHIKSQIPTLQELKLPEVIKELILRKRGLLLVVGAAGSGKSTTLAAMIDYRNQHQAGHIITIEDPIEFTFSYKQSILEQRELGVDTHSFSQALKSCLRESPDVIMIGEIRDRETLEIALDLANTGHLVISTLHANNTYQTLQRILGLFPSDKYKQLTMDLSLNLTAIISQRLITGINRRRIAAVEVMLNTLYVAELIREGKIDGIREAMSSSTIKGMQTFDMALFNLYREKLISLEETLSNADSRAHLEATIKFSSQRKLAESS